MKFINQIESFFLHRTKREKILLFFALLLGVYFALFHQHFLISFEKIQNLREQIQKNKTYIQNNQFSDQSLSEAKSLNHNLKRLIDTINAQSLKWDEAIKQINQYARTHNIAIWNIDSSDEDKNYVLSLSGNTSLRNALLFTNFIEELPLIHIQSFDISLNGNFSLKLKNHKIFAQNLNYTNLTSSQVIQAIQKTLRKTPVAFFDTPIQIEQKSPKPTFKLEAILNHKAKINGKWIQKGESIEGYTLISIQDDSIVLSFQDTQITLNLKSKKILQ